MLYAICYCYSYEADNDALKTFCGWTPRPTERAYVERPSTVINDVLSLTPLFPPQTYCSLLHGHTIFTVFISFLVFVMLKSMAKGHKWIYTPKLPKIRPITTDAMLLIK